MPPRPAASSHPPLPLVLTFGELRLLAITRRTSPKASHRRLRRLSSTQSKKPPSSGSVAGATAATACAGRSRVLAGCSGRGSQLTMTRRLAAKANPKKRRRSLRRKRRSSIWRYGALQLAAPAGCRSANQAAVWTRWVGQEMQSASSSVHRDAWAATLRSALAATEGAQGRGMDLVGFRVRLVALDPHPLRTTPTVLPSKVNTATRPNLAGWSR